jgi:hypothetical protein
MLVDFQDEGFDRVDFEEVADIYQYLFSNWERW